MVCLNTNVVPQFSIITSSFFGDVFHWYHDKSSIIKLHLKFACLQSRPKCPLPLAWATCISGVKDKIV